jgi:hypothetical protein
MVHQTQGYHLPQELSAILLLSDHTGRNGTDVGFIEIQRIYPPKIWLQWLEGGNGIPFVFHGDFQPRYTA